MRNRSRSSKRKQWGAHYGSGELMDCVDEQNLSKVQTAVELSKSGCAQACVCHVIILLSRLGASSASGRLSTVLHGRHSA